MLLTIHTKLLFYKYLGNNPTPSIWLMPPNLIGEKVLFPNKASQQVITWITDKINGYYLFEYKQSDVDMVLNLIHKGVSSGKINLIAEHLLGE